MSRLCRLIRFQGQILHGPALPARLLLSKAKKHGLKSGPLL